MILVLLQTIRISNTLSMTGSSNKGVSERLLDINTPFILPYLEEKSENNLALSDLLWLYHAKRKTILMQLKSYMLCLFLSLILS